MKILITLLATASFLAPAGSALAQSRNVPPIIAKADFNKDGVVTEAEFRDHAQRSLQKAENASPATVAKFRKILSLPATGTISEQQLVGALTAVIGGVQKSNPDADRILAGWTNLPPEGKKGVISFMVSRINNRPDTSGKAFAYWMTIWNGYQQGGQVVL
jgi:hypothetical protein